MNKLFEFIKNLFGKSTIDNLIEKYKPQIEEFLKKQIDEKIEEKVNEKIKDYDIEKKKEKADVVEVLPEPPVLKLPEDAITTEQFGKFPRVPNPWSLPMNLKITSVSNTDVYFDWHKPAPDYEAIIATSDGKGHAFSDKAASHGRSNHYNKHLPFPVYVCVFIVSDNRSKAHQRSPIVKVS